MSESPKGWLVSSLQEIAVSAGGGTPSKADPTYWTDGNVPWVSPKDMKTFNINSSEDTVTERALDRLSLIPSESVLVVVRSGILSRTLPVALSGTAVTINQDMRAFIPKGGISAKYVAYQLIANERRLLDECSKHGTTVASMEGPALARFPLMVAPSAEQTRIVEKLEELLSDLDAGVAELKAAQKKLARYRQSLLKAAVEGALTADWRAERARRSESTESGAQLLARILAERRARWEAKHLAKFKEQGKAPPKDWKDKYPEPIQPDTTGLPPLPEGWVWASVEQLGDVQLGRQRSPDKQKGLSPAKYIRAANITEAGIDFSDVLEMDFNERERITFALKVGDVLLTEASGSPEHVGRPVIWPDAEGLYCFQNTVIRFTSFGISSEFAFRIFQAWQKLAKFQKLSGGVGINHLSAGKFAGVAIPLPSVAEQAAVVDALSTAFSVLAEQEATSQRAIGQCIAQRKNILKAAFSGQLVSQDPNDEPASVLLHRIRAERAARMEKRALKPGRRKATA